jgi:hypothetical protein
MYLSIMWKVFHYTCISCIKFYSCFMHPTFGFHSITFMQIIWNLFTRSGIIKSRPSSNYLKFIYQLIDHQRQTKFDFWLFNTFSVLIYPWISQVSSQQHSTVFCGQKHCVNIAIYLANEKLSLEHENYKFVIFQFKRQNYVII